MGDGKLKKLISYYRPYTKLLMIDLFFSLVELASKVSIPLITLHTIKHNSNLDPSIATIQIMKNSVLMLVIVAVFCISHYIVDYYGHVLGAYIERDMRNEIFEHLQKLSISFYDSEKTGAISSRVMHDLTDIGNVMHHIPEDFIEAFVRLIVSIAILSTINKILTLSLCLLLLMFAILFIIGSPKLSKKYVATRSSFGQLNSQTEETLSSIKIVKLFSNEKFESDKFKLYNSQFIESLKTTFRATANLSSFYTLILELLNPLVVIIGAFLIVKQSFYVEDMLTFIMYTSLFAGTIYIFINKADSTYKGFAGYKRFREMLEIEPEITCPECHNKSILNGHIKFENVCFSYNEECCDVLKDVNFEIKTGDYVAIIGESGGGKTTICDLISRFYDVDCGKITIDQMDIRDIPIDNLRQNIGYLPQECYIFAGTVRDNIRYGKLDAPDGEIIKAAKNANAHEFIMKLENGYDTYLNQKGTNLSGGQRQRLSIARIFLKNPSILIFDEATSALDSENEKFVQNSLERLAKGKTTIVVAHRLSTIQNAKRVLKVTKNGIIEQRN